MLSLKFQAQINLPLQFRNLTRSEDPKPFFYPKILKIDQINSSRYKLKENVLENN